MFNSAYLKVDRANHHIKILKSDLAEYAKSNMHTITTTQNSSGVNHMKVGTSKEPPPAFSLVIGDAVHNLRSALDHAYGIAASAIDHSIDPKTTTFPFFKTKEEVEKAFNRSTLNGSMSTPKGKKVTQVILNEIRPYGGDDVAIRHLNKLDNIDKHRLIIAIIVLRGVNFSGAAGGDTFINCKFIGSPDGHTAMVSSGSIEGSTLPFLDLQFNEVDLPRDLLVIPALDHYSEITRKAVKAIEACFAG